MPPAPATAAEIDEALVPLRRSPARAAILCDIDGTIAPIAARPEQAAVDGRARVALRELATGYGLVGCVSGRRALDARRMVGLAELVYVGNHGLELLEPAAAEPRPAELGPAAGAAAQLLGSLEAGRLERAGLRREDKGPIQALHWRTSADREAAEALAGELAAAAEAEGLHAHWGRMVLELRPTAEIDKGTAIESLLADRRLAAALFGGDDYTDLDGFGGLERLVDDGRLGRAVRVGVLAAEGPPELGERCDVLVDGTEGFCELLEAALS